LLWSKFATYWESAAYRRCNNHSTTGINQQQFVILHLAVILDIVQDAFEPEATIEG